MPFNSKLRADYVEAVNAVLDSAPMDSTDDVIYALNAVLNNECMSNLSNRVKEFAESISEYLRSPACFVELEENYEEFINIVRGRITAKISELSTLTPDEIAQKKEEQIEKITEIRQNHQHMANQSPPPEGSEAHTISYQQMLQNMQFQNESNDVSPQENSILGNQTLISNLEIALAAISQQIIRLTFASDQFRNDRDVVWALNFQ